MRGTVCPVTVPEGAAAVALNDVTWMDDLCLMTRCPGPDSVLAALAKIGGRVVDCCIRFGMSPNLGHNKSEALVGVKGCGARRFRREHLNIPDPTFGIESSMWPKARMRIVASYKHLGGILHHAGGLAKEIRARVGQGWTAFQKHRKTIFAHRHVQMREKVVLFQTLVLSTMLHGCGTWGVITRKELAPLSRAYLSMARRILARHFKGDVLHAGEDRILALLELPTLEIWLHFHRLSYLASFVALDVQAMWAMAHFEGAWLGSVRDSLAWLWLQTDNGAFAVNWAAAWEAWRADILCRPRKWKRLLRYAKQTATHAFVLEEGWQQCRGLAFKCYLKAGAYAEGLKDKLEQGTHVCGCCQQVFVSKQAWAVHALEAHGRVKATRLLVSAETCQCVCRSMPPMFSFVAIWSMQSGAEMFCAPKDSIASRSRAKATNGLFGGRTVWVSLLRDREQSIIGYCMLSLLQCATELPARGSKWAICVAPLIVPVLVPPWNSIAVHYALSAC